MTSIVVDLHELYRLFMLFLAIAVLVDTPVTTMILLIAGPEMHWVAWLEAAVLLPVLLIALLYRRAGWAGLRLAGCTLHARIGCIRFHDYILDARRVGYALVRPGSRYWPLFILCKAEAGGRLVGIVATRAGRLGYVKAGSCRNLVLYIRGDGVELEVCTSEERIMEVVKQLRACGARQAVLD